MNIIYISFVTSQHSYKIFISSNLHFNELWKTDTLSLPLAWLRFVNCLNIACIIDDVKLSEDNNCFKDSFISIQSWVSDLQFIQASCKQCNIFCKDICLWDIDILLSVKIFDLIN